MCSVSWQFQPSGYRLFFNRDEKRTRAEAEPPALHEHEGVRWIAPVDPQSGGTWIFVNAFGLCGFLLNDYSSPPREAEKSAFRSRGTLLWSLATMPTPEAFSIRLSQLLQEVPFRPCRIGLIAPDKQARLWHWNQASLRPLNSQPAFQTSSSHATGQVEQQRLSNFLRLSQTNGDTAAGLADFHQLFNPLAPHASLLMHRPDARTVSIQQVEVGQKATLTYQRVQDSNPPNPAPKGLFHLDMLLEAKTGL